MINVSNVNNINLCIAEIIDSVPLNTYSWKNNSGEDVGNHYDLFSVTARVDGYVNRPIIKAKPANTNIKKIPLIGEMVLVFQLKSSVPSTDTYNQNQWYYLSTVDIVSSINHNVLTGYTSTSEQEQQVGKDFPEKMISPLQPYQGDILVEGRFGNSIRLGNSVKPSSIYTIQQQSKFTSSDAGDPIIILSNGRDNKPAKEFVHEDIKTDNSSLYLTSKQSISGLNLNHTIRTATAASSYVDSQFIGVADRVVLHSKKDIIVLDSKSSIEINSNNIQFGISNKKEPMLHSTAVLELLKILIRTIQMGFKDSSGVLCTPLNKELNNTKKIQDLLQKSKNTSMYCDIWKTGN